MNITKFTISRELLMFGLGGLSVVASFAVFRTIYRSKSFLKNSQPIVSIDPKRNPPWKVGENQPLPFENKVYNSYTSADLQKSGGLYGLVISSVIPRPIALVSSQDANGVINCAPYSYFNVVSHDPPLVVIGNCINMRTNEKKDTLRNIEETGEFVVNIMSSWYTESANHCCAPFSPEINEMELSGLTSLPSDLIKPPRVGEAAVQLECEAYELKSVINDEGKHSVTLVIGRVKKFHVLQEVLTKESVDTMKPIVDWMKLSPVARMGGDTYTMVSNGFDLKRPDGKLK